MAQDNTECQEKDFLPPPAAPATLRPVLEWAQRKSVERWLLCLAATHAKWLPEQQDDAVDEVTEADFDAAVKAASEKLEECRRVHGRAWIRTLTHRDMLIGVIVKKMRSGERRVVLDTFGKAKSDEEAGKYLQDYFHSQMQWPTLPVYTAAIETIPGADDVLALKWLQSLGAEAQEPAKKR